MTEKNKSQQQVNHSCLQEDRIKLIESSILTLEETVIESRDDVKESQNDIKEIKNVLLPSEYHPDNGLISSFAKMKKQLDDVNKSILVMRTWVVSITGVSGFVLILLQIIKLLQGGDAS